MATLNSPIKLVVTLLAGFASFALSDIGFAQHPPAIGYMFPPGGQTGQTMDVVLGGYDWTPDMQVFVHDPRIQLEILEPPGPIIIPGPPYWFGKKSRRAPFRLPREVKARLTIPADVAPGIVTWQAANANGATAIGRFAVNDTPNVVEHDSTPTMEADVQSLKSLPVVVSGQIKRVQEVDRYRFTATKSGPITCAVAARGIDSDLNAVIEVHDQTGQLIAEAADTAGNDTALTFRATQSETYSATIYDLDFRGNRAFVYQLKITEAPRIVTAIPVIGRRGETRAVKFVGYGLATGQAQLETVTREVTFTNDATESAFDYRLTTEYGACSAFPLHISDDIQQNESVAQLTIPCGVTGVLEERYGEDRYQATGKKGDVWAVAVSNDRTNSLVDAVLTIFDGQGNQLVRNDDGTGSTDAEIEFTVPADGGYSICVTDVASASGSQAATYHLSIRNAEPDFQIFAPDLLNAPIEGTAALLIKVTRRGGFTDAIDLTLSGLPEGVTVPEPIRINEKTQSLTVELTAAADVAAIASVATVTGTATIDEQNVERASGPILVATTIEPPFTIDAEGQDDVTKWPRGTTFPAPVLITRNEGFVADIVLEMTSTQGRHRQGISAPELLVPPGVNRVLYPVYLPEWLETTRTSRMVVNGVAKVTDPQGNERYSVSRQITRMGFLPTGALLKISAEEPELQIARGKQISIPINIDRSVQLTERVTLELYCAESVKEIFRAAPLKLAADEFRVEFPVNVAESPADGTEYRLTIRATLLKGGSLPVISETNVLIEVMD